MARAGGPGSGPIGETNDARRGAGWLASAALSPSQPRICRVEPYFVSTLLVALAEMGDRTQLLAIMLASRYRKPIPILLGIFVATVANHTLASLVGFYLAGLLQAVWFKYVVAGSFIAMAVWALIPDKQDDDAKPSRLHLGVFVTTVVSFFLVEMGDKTQVATAALAARYHEVLIVAAGTTSGMMIANIPAVLLGHAVTRVLPIRALQIAAALLYLGLGLWAVATTAGWIR
jgi:putative Ca2+/H+ antiporter (TMEM165/GDT1 family)